MAFSDITDAIKSLARLQTDLAIINVKTVQLDKELERISTALQSKFERSEIASNSIREMHQADFNNHEGRLAKLEGKIDAVTELFRINSLRQPQEEKPRLVSDQDS